jgi:hypothetical protein
MGAGLLYGMPLLHRAMNATTSVVCSALPSGCGREQVRHLQQVARIAAQQAP